MKGKRYTEEQIIGLAGARIGDLVCEDGFSEQSFYRWSASPVKVQVRRHEGLGCQTIAGVGGRERTPEFEPGRMWDSEHIRTPQTIAR